MVMELGADVWWYDLRSVNAYLVDDDGVLTLVDVGTPWDGRKLILGINDLGYSLQDVDRVLLTHYDFDHVGGLNGLYGLDATIYIGSADANFLLGKQRPPLTNHKGLFQFAAGSLLKDPHLPVERVEDGDEIGSFTAYHTPGHTPGHMAYVSEPLQTAFLGDLVRESNGRLEPSPWLHSYNTDHVTESIRDLATRTPEFDVAAIGHGVPFKTNGSEQLERIADSM